MTSWRHVEKLGLFLRVVCEALDNRVLEVKALLGNHRSQDSCRHLVFACALLRYVTDYIDGDEARACLLDMSSRYDLVGVWRLKVFILLYLSGEHTSSRNLTNLCRAVILHLLQYGIVVAVSGYFKADESMAEVRVGIVDLQLVWHIKVPYVSFVVALDTLKIEADAL